MNSQQSPIVLMEQVSKIYGRGETQVHALREVNVTINRHEFTSIMGPSGSGKSTMLHVLAGLDTPTSGSITVDHQVITSMNDDALTRFRRERIGFIFQSFNLVPTLSAMDNILLPLKLKGYTMNADDKAFMNQVITMLGLKERLSHRPGQLSGGQVQRVAVARALVARPAMIVADEPTGNLDSESTAEVMGLLRQAVDTLGQTVVMVTHDEHLASQADRILVVKDGQIARDEKVGALS
ncbi:ABC transporter ATP-binding protein [Actinomyces vulturis]|uniref:ABC transporter ATP-binding protein n=1 Tax=Actinomyces vulturis TaxID=1857645 RepID=UPI00082D50A8|nr:ABC transporter ATP-binding protein [Actinomyces vulturis]